MNSSSQRERTPFLYVTCNFGPISFSSVPTRWKQMFLCNYSASRLRPTDRRPICPCTITFPRRPWLLSNCLVPRERRGHMNEGHKSLGHPRPTPAPTPLLRRAPHSCDSDKNFLGARQAAALLYSWVQFALAWHDVSNEMSWERDSIGVGLLASHLFNFRLLFEKGRAWSNFFY